MGLGRDLVKLQGFDSNCVATVAGFMRSACTNDAFDDASHLLCQPVPFGEERT